MNATTYPSTRTCTAVVLAAVVAGGAWALAGSAPAGAADGTLSVKETVGGFKSLDLGAKGLSLGDHIAFVNVVKDGGGVKIGIAPGDCTLYGGKTEATAKYHCTQTFKLKGGQIFTGGVLDFAKKNTTWAIMGGTGEYRGASGQLDATTTDDVNYDDVFRFDD